MNLNPKDVLIAGSLPRHHFPIFAKLLQHDGIFWTHDIEGLNFYINTPNGYQLALRPSAIWRAYEIPQTMWKRWVVWLIHQYGGSII